MKKLILVYNERASQHERINEEVLVPARNLRGWLVGKYAIRPTGFDDNVESLAKLVEKGDLMIVAGGDGTATMAMNAALKSGKDVTLAILGYGNFNDVATMLGEENLEKVMMDYEAGKLRNFYPLEVKVNGGLWRYAPCYYTMGLLAEATTIMEDKKVRERLKTGKRKPGFSLRMAVKWYLKHHKKMELPEGTINDATMPNKATDYLAVISPRMAGIMEGGEWWREQRGFGSSVQSLGGLWRMVGFGLRSVFKGTPLEDTERDVIEFVQPSEVMMQVGGEYEKMKNVSKVEVVRAEKNLKVVTSRN